MRVKVAELAGMVGHPFNPASSLQVADVVYKELGFKPTATTATGLVSTDDAELKKTGHPVAKGIIQYRGLLKLKSTYADNMIRSAHPDENGVYRMHTVLKTTRVETGRLSSSKDDNGEGANLQNIPTRNKEGKAIKNGFIAPRKEFKGS
jgi:DNA polymerase-1